MISFLVIGASPAGAEALPELEAPSIWSHFVDLRAESGYRDNPTYTANNPSGTVFTTLKAEYTLTRLPIDSWQVLMLGSGDFTRFLDSSQTDHEVFVFGLFQVQKETARGRHWEVGLQHVYQDQVVDASTTVVNQGSVAIHGHTLQGYGRWRQQWDSGWWLAVKPAWEWQTLDAPLDDSYEPGMSFSVGKDIGRRTALSLTYSYQERVFDRLTPTDALGVPQASGALHFRQHHVEGVYRRELDPNGRWRLTAKLGWLGNEDNGEGYYDYDRCRMALELRWRNKPWEIKLSSRASYYDYRVQVTGVPGTATREKLLLLTGLQVRREFKDGWYVVLRGEREQSLSNLVLDRYEAHMASVGIGWEN